MDAPSSNKHVDTIPPNPVRSTVVQNVFLCCNFSITTSFSLELARPKLLQHYVGPVHNVSSMVCKVGVDEVWWPAQSPDPQPQRTASHPTSLLDLSAQAAVAE